MFIIPHCAVHTTFLMQINVLLPVIYALSPPLNLSGLNAHPLLRRHQGIQPFSWPLPDMWGYTLCKCEGENVCVTSFSTVCVQ